MAARNDHVIASNLFSIHYNMETIYEWPGGGARVIYFVVTQDPQKDKYTNPLHLDMWEMPVCFFSL